MCWIELQWSLQFRCNFVESVLCMAAIMSRLYEPLNASNGHSSATKPNESGHIRCSKSVGSTIGLFSIVNYQIIVFLTSFLKRKYTMLTVIHSLILWSQGYLINSAAYSLIIDVLNAVFWHSEKKNTYLSLQFYVYYSKAFKEVEWPHVLQHLLFSEILLYDIDHNLILLKKKKTRCFPESLRLCSSNAIAKVVEIKSVNLANPSY